jgi:uncharacterized protein YjbI with pentapeptide repeats
MGRHRGLLNSGEGNLNVIKTSKLEGWIANRMKQFLNHRFFEPWESSWQTQPVIRFDPTRLTIANLGQVFPTDINRFLKPHVRLIQNLQFTKIDLDFQSDLLAFENCEFIECSMRIRGETPFYNCRLFGCDFSGAYRRSFAFSVIERCAIDSIIGDFSYLLCDPDLGRLANEIPVSNAIYSCRIEKSIFTNIFVSGNIANCLFSDCVLEMNQIEEVSNCRFQNSEFRTSQFCQSMQNTHIFDCHFAKDFSFGHDLRVSNCVINRRSLQSLGPNRGDLTDGHMQSIEILDPLDTVRRKFRGIYFYLHWMSLIAFIAPIAVFAVMKVVMLHLDRTSERMPLIKQMLYYILSGGMTSTELKISYMAIFIFLFYLIFNLSRGLLYWKLSDIETDEAIRQAPVVTPITQWKPFPYLWISLRIGAWVTFILGLVNICIYLQTPVPK